MKARITLTVALENNVGQLDTSVTTEAYEWVADNPRFTPGDVRKLIPLQVDRTLVKLFAEYPERTSS